MTLLKLTERIGDFAITIPGAEGGDDDKGSPTAVDGDVVACEGEE